MKFKCDMCGKTFKVVQQTDIETHLKYSHSFQDIPLIKKYAQLIFKIHEKIESLKKEEDTYSFYPVSGITEVKQELKSLLENEK